MKRRILLVDDEVAVLLTMKAVLEISGFEVETAASAREGKHRLRSSEYHMIITDMRMESDEAGREVVQAARNASYNPAVALLTAFPVDESDWQQLGADKLLLKPMHTRVLLEQIEHLFESHERKLAALAVAEDLEAASAPPVVIRPVKEAASRPARTAPAPKATKKAVKKAAPKAAKKAVKKATKKAIRKSGAKKAALKSVHTSKLGKNAAKKIAGRKPIKIAPRTAKKKAAKKSAKRR